MKSGTTTSNSHFFSFFLGRFHRRWAFGRPAAASEKTKKTKKRCQPQPQHTHPRKTPTDSLTHNFGEKHNNPTPGAKPLRIDIQTL